MAAVITHRHRKEVGRVPGEKPEANGSAVLPPLMTSDYGWRTSRGRTRVQRAGVRTGAKPWETMAGKPPRAEREKSCGQLRQSFFSRIRDGLPEERGACSKAELSEPGKPGKFMRLTRVVPTADIEASVVDEPHSARIPATSGDNGAETCWSSSESCSRNSARSSSNSPSRH